MSSDVQSADWSVSKTLDLFDVARDGEGRFVALTGMDTEEGRQVVEGTQVLAQAIVAATKTLSGKSMRSAHAVFSRPITVEPHVELAVDVVQEGRSIATVIVTAWPNLSVDQNIQHVERALRTRPSSAHRDQPGAMAVDPGRAGLTAPGRWRAC